MATRSSRSEGRLVEIPAGEYVFREGDLGTEMFVVRSGEVEILRDGEPPEAIAVLEKGDFFGEMSLLENIPRSASALARTDLVLLRVDGAMFTDLVRSQPEFAVGIMRRLSRRLRELDRRLAMKTSAEDSAALRSGTPVGKATDAVLVHPGTGLIYPLTLQRPALVGRRDPISGVQPQVDLAEVDTERSCSRRHARFYLEDSKILLVEELGATNGTFVNETRLRAGVPAPVAGGDRVRFGLVTLELEIR